MQMRNHKKAQWVPNNKKGITLLALVLTVVILLIMAGISFNALAGDNGILNKAKDAKIKQEDEETREELQLAWSARMSKFYEAVSSRTNKL